MKNKKKYISLKKIQKRDGRIVPFDAKHILRAIYRAMISSGEGAENDAESVTYKVLDALLAYKKEKNAKSFIPAVEKIQDIVENELIANNFI